jgi:hypothetical protein
MAGGFDFNPLHQPIAVLARLDQHHGLIGAETFSILSDRDSTRKHHPVPVRIRRPDLDAIGGQIHCRWIEPLKNLCLQIG